MNLRGTVQPGVPLSQTGSVSLVNAVTSASKYYNVHPFENVVFHHDQVQVVQVQHRGEYLLECLLKAGTTTLDASSNQY